MPDEHHIPELQKDAKHGYYHASFEDPVYGFSHFLVVGFDDDGRDLLGHFLKKHLKVKNYRTDDGKGYAGKFVPIQRPGGITGSVIFVQNWSWRSMQSTIALAHECLHAALFVLNDRGVKLDADNDEPLTYYHTYLMRTCLDIIDWKFSMERGRGKR